MTGRIAYALLFTVALPVALALWARRLDALLALLALPRVHSLPVGAALVALGVLLAAWSTVVMWTRGGGLPASAFPPRRLVTSGPYRLLADPIYVAASAIAFGAAIAVGSPAALWIVAPTLAAASIAWVLGFERDFTARRFGARAPPLLSIAPDGDERPTRAQRAAACVLVLLPWLVLYEAVELLGPPPDARSTYLSWERALPVLPWTELVYALAYPLVVLAPFVALRRRDLRRFAVDALVAMAIVFPAYLLLPLVAEARPATGTGVAGWLMRAERAYDSPATAFPAYHVVWSVLAARVYAARWASLRWPLRVLVAAIAASCLTTGMHAVADVVAGLVVVPLVDARHAVWRALLGGAERVANSWREWTLGPVRLLVHGLYAGVGAALGVALATALAGPARLPWLLALTATAVLGAAAWAQLVEGSPQLLRPYGYFGSVLAVAAMTLVVGAGDGDVWVPLVAFVVGSTITYAFGRLRCLVQGCCHGAPAPAGVGIVYRHPCSRVVRIAGLAGVPLYATPLHSLLAMLAIGVVLLRLWTLRAPLPLVLGSYFVLTGLARFVEEHHRGEPQTVIVAGLRLYQWLAIALVVAGAAVTCVRGPAAPPPVAPGWGAVLPLLAVAVLAGAAYGVDFPRSRRRFSRLA